MMYFSLIISFLAGLLISIQGVANSVGSKAIGTPWMLVWLSVVQIVPPVILMLVRHQEVSLSQSLILGWKWYILSGAIGIIAVAGLSFAIAKTGSLTVFVLVVLGQIIGAAVADQFGLFGSPVIHISPMRIVSILVILLGVLMLLKSGTNAQPVQSGHQVSMVDVESKRIS